MATTTETRTEKGISLARGPALVLGTILLAAGLYFLYKQHTFEPFSNFPDGTAKSGGNVFLGIFGANGWTGELTAVGGGLLLFGAAQHLLAKTMSLIVGVALGAAAVIALISGDVLGMAAANGWTELGWGAVAAILLLNTVLPRRRRTVDVTSGEPMAASRAIPAEPVRREPVEPVRREPVETVRSEPVEAVRDEPVEPVRDEPVETVRREPVETVRSEDATAPATDGAETGTATGATRVVEPETEPARVREGDTQATRVAEPAARDREL